MFVESLENIKGNDFIGYTNFYRIGQFHEFFQLDVNTNFQY
jgi:hypothetical protein